MADDSVSVAYSQAESFHDLSIPIEQRQFSNHSVTGKVKSSGRRKKHKRRRRKESRSRSGKSRSRSSRVEKLHVGGNFLKVGNAYFMKIDIDEIPDDSENTNIRMQNGEIFLLQEGMPSKELFAFMKAT